jgi:small subunit ribosomal protein S12
MTTINQTQTYKRIPKKSFVFCTSLKGNPQVRGRYLKTLIITPRKPNSAMRKVGRVLLVNKKKVFTKVAGSGLYPQKFAVVLVKGHGYKDTPSVKYSVMRGKYDCLTFSTKIKKRSLYIVKNKFVIYVKKKLK